MTTQNPGSDPLDNAGTPAFVMDGDGLIVEWNRRAQDRFGWSSAEANGRKLSDLIIPERHRASHEAGLAHFMKGGTPGAFLNRPLKITMLHRDGHEFDLAIRIGTETTPQGRRFPTYLD